jgi:hypothetical protein
MSVTRIEEVLQPAWVRTVSVLTDSTATFGARLQSLLRRIAAASAEAADLLVALVVPASLVAMVLGLWRLTADMEWTSTFPISTGFFSHWQVWIALAIGLKFGASALLAKVRTEQDSQAAAKTDRPA